MAQIDVDMSDLPVSRDPEQIARETFDAYEDEHLGEDLSFTGFCLGLGMIIAGAAVMALLLDQAYRAVEAAFRAIGA